MIILSAQKPERYPQYDEEIKCLNGIWRRLGHTMVSRPKNRNSLFASTISKKMSWIPPTYFAFLIMFDFYHLSDLRNLIKMDHLSIIIIFRDFLIHQIETHDA